MINIDYNSLPDSVKSQAIKSMSELLLDFKSISPEGVSHMYSQTLKYLLEEYMYNNERPAQND